ncbi:MAG TPA: hypothetical protein DFR83_24775, partial [Deltaproteobacteria bacterium]|nr:hypothetical protein [Deltaproteobacteria bacterium]
MRRFLPLLALAACAGGTDSGGSKAIGSGTDDGRDDTAGDEGGGGGGGSGGTVGGGTAGDDGSDTGVEPDPSAAWSFGDDTVTVTVEEVSGLRAYTLRTTHTLRDGAPQERTFTEQDGDPILRSGVLLTDALFAMAVDDARLNAVSQISDGAFAEPVDCECYKTGDLWNWVWTRDIAYATELGLAWLDPDRAANSLLFKLSEEKGGGNLQIVQDTGTGGSWPISTDRVSWVRGAMAVLRYTNHTELREKAIEAMRNTAATDRLYAWDARDGLYRGETSFLDWREQTYPDWTAGDVVHIGMSKSLSTNLDHLFLLRSLEDLTGETHGADALAEAIDQAFWDGIAYSSYKTTELDPTPAQRHDLLATAFAVMDLGTHPEALGNYPHGPYGPPVIFPQQQLTPIYHNRGIWPFVTAYSVIAARQANNGAVLDAGLDSLIRGAALNLSHMENFELATGANWLDDGDYSGPIVNSQRQLWSVAGFLGAVAHGVFGVRGEDGSLTASPILPSGAWFADGATLTLRGETFTIVGDTLAEGRITTFETADWQDLFGARTPSVVVSGSDTAVTVEFSSEETDATFSIYKDGVLVAEDASSPWTDETSTTACYSVVAQLKHAGQPSTPQCWWGDDYRRIQSVQAEAFTANGGDWSTEHGRGHYGNWGARDHTLSTSITPQNTGEHYIQVTYGNGSGGFDTGITATVKWVDLVDDG